MLPYLRHYVAPAMVHSWQKRPIASLGRVVTGKTPPTRQPGNFGGNYPFITIPDLDGRTFIDCSERSLSEEGLAAVSSSLLPAGAVLMSCIATVGKTGMTVRPSVTNQQINALIPNKDVDGRFLYYVFTQLGHELEAAGGGGSVYTNVSKSRFSSIEVTIPVDKAEQRAIASILGALDDKIQMNRKMSATLQEMGRALFKSWFVDFDPVRAKAEGRNTGVAQEIAALFPDSFEQTDRGQVPKGWRLSTIGFEASRCGGSVQTGPFGSQLHASDYVDAGVPVVMPQDIERGRVSTQRISHIDDSDAERLSRHRLRPGDLVYSRRGDVEKHALIGERECNWICGTGCLLVRLGPLWPSPIFASIHLDTPEIRAWISRHAIGATMPNLNTKILSATPMLVPPDRLLRAFSVSTDALWARGALNCAESETLSKLRDALLPKLISGEIRVSDAERIVAKSA